MSDEPITLILEKNIEDAVKCIKLILKFFKYDDKKVMAWLLLENPLLGHSSPMEMIGCGRAHKLLAFIENQFAGNHP